MSGEEWSKMLEALELMEVLELAALRQVLERRPRAVM